MRKLSEFLVKKRNWIFGCMLIITVISAFLMQNVNIITDMTEYLPDNSAMKQGMDIMESQFPDADTDQTIRVMVDNLNADQKDEFLETMQNIKNVSSVDYDAESDDYNKDEHTLYVLHTEYDYDSAEVTAITDTIEDMQDDYHLAFDTGETQEQSVPPMILFLAFVILMVVLFFMCSSWVEPFLFLATIGIAIVINMGTNAFLTGVSETTHSIAAILQLVLSMDYSIILMNRYRQELKQTDNKELAMTAAVKNAFSSVVSSSLTTIVGLLALVFMNFKIGADMGIVLAKGVLVSLICILTVLPALILIFDKAIQKTAKKVLPLPMTGISRFSFHGKYIITGLFVVAFVALYLVKGNTAITYSMTVQSDVDKIFPKTNTLVVVYENKDEENIAKLAENLEKEKSVKSISAYATTLGKQYHASELTEMLETSGMTEEINLDDSMIQLIYYMHFNSDSDKTMTLSEFFGFMQEYLSQHEEYASQMDADAMQQMQAFSAMIQNPAYASQQFTAEELYQMLGSQTDLLDEGTVKLMYQMYFCQKDYDDTWTMSMEDLFSQVEQMASDNTYASLIPESMTDSIKDMKTQLDDGKAQLVGKDYSRMIVTTNLPEESDETTEFLSDLSSELSDKLSGNSYMIGSSAMEYEMSQTFNGELNKISLITMIAIFVVVLLTFRSIAVPLILVCVIQGSVYATMVTMGILGDGIYYLALLIVQSILMGATIDYGILFSNYYRENRKTQKLEDALTAAYNGSIHTIMTSGLIMVLVTFILGFAFSDPTIGQICHIISAGVTIAIILILFVLPGILCALDKFTSGVKKDGNK